MTIKHIKLFDKMLLPMIIDKYCGVKKENLTFPFESIVVVIACGTMSTGY